MRNLAAVAGLLMAFGVTGAAASPELQAQIKAGCLLSTSWGDAACACVADQAASLNDLQQTFLAATMNQKQAEAAQAALQMSQAETQQAAVFLASAAPACQ